MRSTGLTEDKYIDMNKYTVSLFHSKFNKLTAVFYVSVLLLMIKWRHNIVKVLWIHEPQQTHICR